MARLHSLFCTFSVCLSLSFPSQAHDAKDLPENKGSITGENVYHNPSLGITISLPGAWHFFDRTMYTSPEAKKKEEEEIARKQAICQGPLCGTPEIDVALQSPSAPPLVHAIFLSAYRLSPEYQNRLRHPLKRFAEVMVSDNLGDNWVPDGELTAVQLGGKPAYRLVMHHRRTTYAKGFVYVADANGSVFMLLGTALSEPEKLQTAIENLQFANVISH